ncbi:MAG: ATP-binding cassette domain-containing protein [Myxococcota bacterium]
MADEALGCTDLVKRYRDGDQRIAAVDGVNFSMPPGQLWALEGPSGSGKTTLLLALGGLLAPTSGDVRVAGRSTVGLRDHHRTRWRRAKVGFVFQELQLVRGMTLLENVLLPRVPEGGATGEERDRALALLERFGVAEKAGTQVERLSGGERQRGALARAMLHAPPVLLLDEPTAHVDAENAARIVGLLEELKGGGPAILVTTHDPRLAEHAAVDRRLVMRDGKLASAAL